MLEVLILGIKPLLESSPDCSTTLPPGGIMWKTWLNEIAFLGAQLDQAQRRSGASPSFTAQTETVGRANTLEE